MVFIKVQFLYFALMGIDIEQMPFGCVVLEVYLYADFIVT